MTELCFTPDASTTRDLRDALGRFATGVTVITAPGPDGPIGFTANSFTALSLDPALVLWCPAKASARTPVFAAAAHFAIHVLAVEQAALSQRFVRGGAGFDGLAHRLDARGVPVLPDTLARFDCARHAQHDGGDHVILVGRVMQFSLRDGAPLVFSQGGYGGFTHGG